MNTANAVNLQKIPGFETTEYAYLQGNIVWAGLQTSTNHPRNAIAPWQPEPYIFDAQSLYEGALICRSLFNTNHRLDHSTKGLMLWLQNKDMPFPLNLSKSRFDAIKHAYLSDDLHNFISTALCVLGLGNGLTPSGDDFVGGMMFALAHAPRHAWIDDLPNAKTRIHNAALVSTNVISAALLDDLMAGKSYSAMHDVLYALDSHNIESMVYACEKLLHVGASSGADMLAGLLLALTTQPTKTVH